VALLQGHSLAIEVEGEQPAEPEDEDADDKGEDLGSQPLAKQSDDGHESVPPASSSAGSRKGGADIGLGYIAPLEARRQAEVIT
jgi:hypothetical protein